MSPASVQPARIRVALITNGFTPNRVPLWNAINDLCDLTLVLLAPTEKSRQWELSFDQVQAETRVVGASQLFVQRIDWGLHFTFNRVLKVLDELQPEAVIVGGYESPGYWAAQWWARRHRIPVVLWMGSTLLSGRTAGNRIFDAVKRRFITQCDAFYTYGRLAGECVEHYGGRTDRIVVGTNHTNAKHFASCERTGAYRRCDLLYVGRLLRHKGPCKLFEALARITDLPWTLTVAGDGELRSKLDAIAERNKYADRISWKKFVQQKDLSEVYRSSDVLIMPSLNEVWGLVVNEALLSGVYVIGSSRAAASVELIQRGVNGDVVEPEPAAIEQALRDAIAQAPFDRPRIRQTIASVTPEGEAEKIMLAVQLAKKSGASQ